MNPNQGLKPISSPSATCQVIVCILNAASPPSCPALGMMLLLELHAGYACATLCCCGDVGGRNQETFLCCFDIETERSCIDQKKLTTPLVVCNRACNGTGMMHVVTSFDLGDYHFFPIFFSKSLEKLEISNFSQKFGKVWKKLFPIFPISELETPTILMPLYRVLYFQHVSKSRVRGTFHPQRSHRSNVLSFSKK